MPRQDDIPLYNRAVAYIGQHFMDERLDRKVVAAALDCSTRQLSRAFEGRPATLQTAIQLLRLHKGRELLRKYRNRSVAQVAAAVHFRNAKHFATRFKEVFGRTPTEERKATAPKRKKPLSVKRAT